MGVEEPFRHLVCCFHRIFPVGADEGPGGACALGFLATYGAAMMVTAGLNPTALAVAAVSTSPLEVVTLGKLLEGRGEWEVGRGPQPTEVIG